MAIYKEDIATINLEAGNIFRSFVKHTIGTADSAADRFGIRVMRGDEEVDLTGCSCYGYFRDPHGNNIALTSNGTIDGNVAYVTLPQACYNYEGQFTLAIKLIGGGVTGTMRIVDGVIDNTNTGSAAAPTGTVPTYSEILSQYDAMAAATAAANGCTAETFDATKAYSAGKYVINSGALYRLTADHAANTTWANTSKVEVKFGNELTNFKKELNVTANQPEYEFVIGETIASNGATTTANYGSHTKQIRVSGGDIVFRTTPAKDSDGKTLIIHVCQYENGVFKSRTSITEDSTGNPIVLSAATDSIIFNFSRQSTSGVTMTQQDIDDYFSMFVYRKAALEVEQNTRVITFDIAQEEVEDEYSSLLSNIPSNTIVWTNKAWWEDAPYDNTNFFYIASIANGTTSRGTMTGQGTQIALFPDSGSMFVRRIKSGSWTDWAKPFYSSNPKYRAFGDSLTWGAVWDSDQTTDLYQANFDEQMPTRIANAIGSTYFWNQGASGARFVKQSQSDTSAIIGTIVKATDFTNVQLVTIGGGRNDSATALGDGATSTANDGTICGAVVDILSYLTTNYPKLQIVMYGVTPQPDGVHLDPEYIFTRVFSGGWSLATYYTEMAKVCARFGVPFIDWYDCTLIQRWGVLSGGYSGGVRNWSHPLSGDIYTQMGNYLAGKVSQYYRG